MDDYHIHTKATDGNADPAEILKLAWQFKVGTIAFTEHISKNPTYDWFKLRDQIYSLESKNVKVLVGVEAKVLNKTGELNVPLDVFASADLILGAIHGVGSAEWLLQSECDIIAHPQIDNANVEQFIDCPKILEINFKHQLPLEILDILVLNTRNVFSFGSDTHDISDFVAAQNYFMACNHFAPLVPCHRVV